MPRNDGRGADAQRVIVPVLIGGGFVLGLLVGRWWALAVPVGFGAWVAIVAGELEVPDWFLGLVEGGIGCVSVGVGIVVRRLIRPAN